MTVGHLRKIDVQFLSQKLVVVVIFSEMTLSQTVPCLKLISTSHGQRERFFTFVLYPSYHS